MRLREILSIVFLLDVWQEQHEGKWTYPSGNSGSCKNGMDTNNKRNFRSYTNRAAKAQCILEENAGGDNKRVR